MIIKCLWIKLEHLDLEVEGEGVARDQMGKKTLSLCS